MKTLILSSFVVACTLLAWAVWRLRPAVPGLARTEAHRRFEAPWRLWLCLVLGGVAASLAVLIAVDAPGVESSVGYARLLFSSHVGTDSWLPMQVASEHMRAHPNVPVFSAVFFEQHVKFQYPLTALLFIDAPMAAFGVDSDTVITALQVLSRLCVPLIALAFFALFKRAVEAETATGPIALRWPATATLLGVSLLGVLLFYPLSRSEYHGQIQTAMTLAAALALLAWQRGDAKLSGALVALCCIIKPQWAIVIVWALLRRQWAFAATATVVGAAFLAVSVVVYGIPNTLDYLPVVSFMGRHGESYFINQSVNGLVNRWLFNGVNLDGTATDWSGTAFPPFHPAVYAATLASSMLLLVFAVFWNRAKTPTATDLALVMLTLTLASPIAWDHHYAVLLPIFAIVVPAVWARRPWGAASLPLLWLVFVLTSQSFNSATNLLASTRLNVVQSYLFFGALGVLALLYRLSWLERQAAPAATPSQGRRRAQEMAGATRSP